jgi:hypothetical protein
MREFAVGAAALASGIAVWRVGARASRGRMLLSWLTLILVVTGSVTLTGGPVGAWFNRGVSWVVDLAAAVINWALTMLNNVLHLGLSGELPIAAAVATVLAASLTGYLVAYFIDRGHRRLNRDTMIVAGLYPPLLALATPGAIGQWIIHALHVITSPVVDLIASLAFNATHWS